MKIGQQFKVYNVASSNFKLGEIISILRIAKGEVLLENQKQTRLCWVKENEIKGNFLPYPDENFISSPQFALAIQALGDTELTRNMLILAFECGRNAEQAKYLGI